MDKTDTYNPEVQRAHWVRLRLLLGTLIALVVADGVISRFLIAQGIAREGNPFLRAWINQDLFLYLKLAGSFLAAVLLWQVSRRFPRITFGVTLFFVVWYTGLVIWSLLIFLIAGRF